MYLILKKINEKNLSKIMSMCLRSVFLMLIRVTLITKRKTSMSLISE